MSTQLSKWGNSLAVRIPKTVAEAAQLSEGDEVEVLADNDGIVIRSRQAAYSLEELVGGITPKNRHDETDWGSPVGGEVW